MADKVSLREYVDAMFAEREKAVSAALAAAEKAVTKAEVNAEKWRENANEWRGAMSDRDRELPSRREVNAEILRIEALIAPLTRMSNNTEGRREGVSLSAVVTLAVATVVVAIVVPVVVALVLH